MIVQKYGTPSGHTCHIPLVNNMHESDTYGDASGAGLSAMECIDDTMTRRLVPHFALLRFLPLHPRGVTSPCFG
jgi:hypothetical protein